jgi:hypothetical protein
MAGHEASLPHTAVDTVIPMTRGVDKLRTVCGRLRRNAARERFCKSSDSRRFRRWEAPASHTAHSCCPAQAPLTLSLATSIGAAVSRPLPRNWPASTGSTAS